jgi:hypothetical protein
MADARESHSAALKKATVPVPNAPSETGEPSQDGGAGDKGPADVRATDALVRKALAFLTELFPAANAHIGYVRKADAPLLGGTASPRNGEGGRFEDIREVPAHPEFLRVVTISVNERISEFLREDDDSHLEAASARFKIPVILAHEWTRHLTGAATEEARAALQAQLPVHIIAHLIADQFAHVAEREAYRFARHGEPQSAHDRLTNTIVETLDYIDKLTRSRVEHQDLSHGLVIAPQPEEESGEPHVERRPLRGQYPEDFRELKRTSLLTDGYQSVLCITPEGRATHILTPDTLGDVPSLLDRDFGSLSFLAAVSKKQEGIGLILRQGGSVMTFASGQPLFSRRSGVWHGLIWNQIRNAMVERYGEVGAELFGVVLILTTSSKGGILAVAEDGADALNLNEKDRVDRARAAPALEVKRPNAASENIRGADVEAEEAEPLTENAEWLLHRLLPAGNILDLSRTTLALLAGIDGATIVDEEGRLISYGAIVQSRQGRSEGARTAAARTLSAHGLVVKVSEDGPVQIFEHGEPVLTV